MLAGVEGAFQGYWGSRKCGKRGIEIVGHVDYIQEAENKVEGMQGVKCAPLFSGVHLCSQVCNWWEENKGYLVAKLSRIGSRHKRVIL